MPASSRPPGPRNRFPGDLVLRFAFDRLGFLQGLARDHGDLAYFHLWGMPTALVNHPDLVRDVLVTQQRLFVKGIGLERAKVLLGEGLLTSEGSHHLRQRRLIQPAFHREAVAAHAGTMAGYAAHWADRWQDRQPIDMAREMAALTLAIAGRTLFGADVEGDAREVGEAVGDAIDAFDLALLPFGDRLVRLPIPPAIRFRRARARLDAIVYRLMAERRAEGAGGHDVLSMLLAARDTEGDGAGMNDMQVRDEALTILLAGHETTANALTWSWYLLSGHPEAEARLHAEVDATAPGRPLTMDDVPHLTWTRAVIAEAMRLFPPAYVLGRRAIAPWPVPGTDWVLPAGTLVLASQFLLHRDPRYWSEPELFRPERWLPAVDGGAREPREKFAWFPFGAGTRICIGEGFAWMEATLVLATLARRWAFRHVPGHRVELQPTITLRPKHGMAMSTISRWTPPTRPSSGA